MLSLQQQLQKKRGNLFDVIRFSNVHSWLKSEGGAVSPCMTRWQWNQCAQRGAAGVEWLVIALSPCMARRHPPSDAVTIPWSAGHRTNVLTRTSTRHFSTPLTEIESWNANVRGNFFIARLGATRLRSIWGKYCLCYPMVTQ